MSDAETVRRMTPLETAAKAAWNLHHPPNKPWEEVPEIIRKGKIREQAAALLALADRLETEPDSDAGLRRKEKGNLMIYFRDMKHLIRKGEPRPAMTYRGARRNDDRTGARAKALKQKRLALGMTRRELDRQRELERKKA